MVIQFDAAPAVSISYPRLKALNSSEIDRARASGYAADDVDPKAPVRRAG
jgi:hypothetical protein